ncbi:pheromone-binding protein Gp-9-like [Odontomachus brunneus]|uniref:pheromone-binding protein Gp-9-like n=1 Tax=Odontomachus brunneus TaxID=486640 RepID=UPI0013F29E6C|nr:pheromone-binding protein Gp-9-like [Odontomachus brunneus]
MKTFVFYVCVFSLIYFISAKALQPQPRLSRKLLATKQDFDECVNMINITSDEMFKMNDILNDTYKVSGNEEKVRKHGCIFHCVLEKVGAMEGSEIIVDKMYSEVRKRVIPQLKDNVIKIVDNCIKAIKTVTEKCQKTFNLEVCLLKAEFKELDEYLREIDTHHTTTPEPEIKT